MLNQSVKNAQQLRDLALEQSKKKKIVAPGDGKIQPLFEQITGVPLFSLTRQTPSLSRLHRRCHVQKGELIGAVVNQNSFRVIAEVPESQIEQFDIGAEATLLIVGYSTTTQRAVVAEIGIESRTKDSKAAIDLQSSIINVELKLSEPLPDARLYSEVKVIIHGEKQTLLQMANRFFKRNFLW